MSTALQTPSMAAGVTMCMKDADAEVKRTGGTERRCDATGPLFRPFETIDKLLMTEPAEERERISGCGEVGLQKIQEIDVGCCVKMLSVMRSVETCTTFLRYRHNADWKGTCRLRS